MYERSKRELIYLVAKGSIGKDMGGTAIPNSVACAISVNNIVQAAVGQPVGGGASTYEMRRAIRLRLYPMPFIWRFVKVPLESAQPGDIILSATGHGNGKLANGHVGIVSENGKIMSNTSADGIFRENYTFEAWKRRYVDLGGFPMEVYRVIR